MRPKPTRAHLLAPATRLCRKGRRRSRIGRCKTPGRLLRHGACPGVRCGRLEISLDAHVNARVATGDQMRVRPRPLTGEAAFVAACSRTLRASEKHTRQRSRGPFNAHGPRSGRILQGGFRLERNELPSVCAWQGAGVRSLCYP